jgi:hypothetical protein
VAGIFEGKISFGKEKISLIFFEPISYNLTGTLRTRTFKNFHFLKRVKLTIMVNWKNISSEFNEELQKE